MLYFGCGKHPVDSVPNHQHDVDYCPECSVWRCIHCREVEPASVVQPKDWTYQRLGYYPTTAYHIVNGVRHDVFWVRHETRRVAWPPAWVGWTHATA